MRYHITWDIDLHAENARAAAEEALAIMRDPDSLATVFLVWAEDAEDGETIDLAED